jgi:hypothetical protein
MRPGHTTPATAAVLNTPELLDLILSNLRMEDILFRAELICRGFRDMIKTSPTIESILAMTKLLAPSLYPTSITQYSQTIIAERTGASGTLLHFDFKPLSIEHHVSSRSFRNLHLPEAEMNRAIWWLARPGNDFLLHGELLPADLDASIVTVAGLLKFILERERVRVTEYGFEVVELDIWYE